MRLLLLVLLSLCVWSAQTLATPMTVGLPAHAPLTSQKRVMVLLDDPELKAQTKDFFDLLTQGGYSVRYKKLLDGLTTSIRQDGEWEQDHLFVFTASTGVSPSDRMISSILEFVDVGGNLVLVTSAKSSKWTVELAKECGASVGNVQIVDAFNGGDFAWPQQEDALRVVGQGSGVVHTSAAVNVLPTESARGLGGVAALRAATTAYLRGQSKKAPMGDGLSVVAALQMRNNARVTVVGSLDLFVNPKNRPYVAALTQWTMGLRGVLRVASFTHALADGSAPEKQIKRPHKANPLPKSTFPEPDFDPEAIVYREKDAVKLTLKLELASPASALSFQDPSYVAFQPNDVQLEVVMLDPYVRTTLVPSQKDALTTRDLVLPDRYGVFKFRVKYSRPGYSNLLQIQPFSLRPYRHNEYERFIVGAYPYYVSSFVVMSGFFVVALAFGFSSGEAAKAEKSE